MSFPFAVMRTNLSRTVSMGTCYYLFGIIVFFFCLCLVINCLSLNWSAKKGDPLDNVCDVCVNIPVDVLFWRSVFQRCVRSTLGRRGKTDR